jgi:hypothetical protein
MRDSIRRFNDHMAQYNRGKIVVPVRVFNVKRVGHLIEVPTLEKLEVRPMSLKQIKKRDPDAMRDDSKRYFKMPNKKPKVKKYWAYLSTPKTAERMSNIVVG